MKKELITIERRTYVVNGEIYHVLLIPEDDGQAMSYYIQKDGYGIITHYLCEPIEKFNPDTVDANIAKFLPDMIKCAKLDIDLLEVN